MSNTTSIRLHESKFARAYRQTELIHKNEFEKVMQLIKNQLDEIEKQQQKDLTPPRYHNTISVLGSRGTGKTSFLYSVLEELVKQENSRVEKLGLIDPTLIEEKEHIFLLVVSLINQKVIEKLKGKECGLDTKAYKERTQWEAQLKKLAKGLPTLAKVGEDHRTAHWQNQDYIMEKGLAEVNAAFELEKNFHDLVDLALGILGKKAFILALDDIDVNMRKGEDVLEMIRKYITTPNIITLLSGNYKLYSLNVRKIQWMQFEANCNYEPQMDYKTMVNELEGQYMMKVLKPENRIRLYSLFEAISYHEQEYYIDKYDKKKNIRIEKAYEQVLKRWGIKGKTQLKIFCNYMLGVSFRSQVHFLINNEVECTTVLESIEAFLSRLYAGKVKVDLAVSRPDMLCVVVQQYLQALEFSPDNYLLTPSMDDDNTNACFTAFTIMFAKQLTTSQFLLFDYAVRIGLTNSVLLRLDPRIFSSFYQHTGVSQSLSLRNYAGLSLGYVYDEATTYSMILKGLDAKSKTKDKEGRIDYELGKDDVSIAVKVVSYLPVVLIAKNNETHVNASLYSLLAVISDILRRFQTRESIEELLLNFSQLRVYPAVTRSGQNNLQTVDDYMFQASSIENLIGQGVDDSLTKLAGDLEKWAGGFKQSIPPYLIGKIMTRLDRAIQQISQPSYGEYMHRCITAFLNACLVEETLENYEKDGKKEGVSRLNLNNVLTDDKLFVNNLEFINRNDAGECIPVTVWLMKCPLLVPFLKQTLVCSKGYTDLLKTQIKEDADSDYQNNVYGVLCRVKRNIKIDDGVKYKFTGDQKKVEEMKKIIEDHYLDYEKIVNAVKEEATRLLNESGIFSNKIQPHSVAAFQKNAKSIAGNKTL